MLIDLLSPDNNINFNITLANSIGLHPAIYISELMSIYEKAHRKGVIENNYFQVDRSYVKRRTTFDLQEQRNLDTILIDLNIIKQKSTNKDWLMVNLDTLIALTSTENIKRTQQDIEAILAKNAVAKSKPEYIAKGMMKHIKTMDNSLREKYYKWILSVQSRYGYINTGQVLLAQEKLDNYSKCQFDVLHKLLDIAICKGYNNMDYIINIFEKDYAQEFKIKKMVNQKYEQPIGDEEF